MLTRECSRKPVGAKCNKAEEKIVTRDDQRIRARKCVTTSKIYVTETNLKTGDTKLTHAVDRKTRKDNPKLTKNCNANITLARDPKSKELTGKGDIAFRCKIE